MDAGADAVKFQTFKTENIITSDAPKSTYHIETTGDDREQTWFELLKTQEISKNMHVDLIEYCAEKEGKQPSLKQIIIYTDSTYVKEGITVWINTWEKNDWKTADKKNVKNVDLWKKLKDLVRSNPVEWRWIKGHSKDPMNDLADELAKKATPI